ncbi:hypothetical protein L6164_025304 [Bauhinia variegata]|uniref:Uncharacterized protein n=1 Tax=Bauhinia variegata TaxID=167791 RepID=A0ACB9M062_BAUVA|nr:hypothetical protein L6164_025304 [Bauhinia variegata]
MAAIELNTKCSIHIRCNSLPSAPHPIVSQFEEHLDRLKSSEEALSSSTISHKLSALQDLHDCTDKLLQLSCAKQALARDHCNELLEGSLMLLDIFSIAKDILLQSKESLMELESFVRRRRGGEIAFTVEVGKYLASRKKVKKATQKSLRNLKATKNEFSKADKETFSLIGILKEAEAITVSSSQSLLMFISDPNGQSRQSKFLIISKLMQPKRVACNSEKSDINEFGKVDATLNSLISHKSSPVENFRKDMENLEMCIQDLEDRIESLSRQLIRTRVSLLNIINN